MEQLLQEWQQIPPFQLTRQPQTDELDTLYRLDVQELVSRQLVYSVTSESDTMDTISQ